jgi:NAD+ kinase
MKIAIFGRNPGKLNRALLDSLIDVAGNMGVELLVHQEFANKLKLKSDAVSFFTKGEELKGNVDCLFSLGGDGTLLNAAILIQRSAIPVLGINTGRLGFLSSIQADEFVYAIEDIKKKKFTLDKRTMLQLSSKGNLYGDQNFALNEVTILKKDISSMITTHVYLDGHYLNTYWGDGIIVATPTGSTAYSLSCGGPIVMPESGNMIITPIAPHNLNVRPIVIPDSSTIGIKLEKGPRSHLVTLDSRPKSISSELEFEIKKADFTVNLIRMEGYSFFNTLRNKLNWGLDKRN